MDKVKTIKKIKALSEEIQKTGDEESMQAAYALNFVALFLAIGSIDLLLAFFGNLGAMIKRAEAGKTQEQLIVLPESDILVPN